jgi:hypothetical protein
MDAKPYLADDNIRQLSGEFQRQKNDIMRKRLRAKIRVLSDNRRSETVQYDHRGRKQGKLQVSHPENWN